MYCCSYTFLLAFSSTHHLLQCSNGKCLFDIEHTNGHIGWNVLKRKCSCILINFWFGNRCNKAGFSTLLGRVVRYKTKGANYC